MDKKIGDFSVTYRQILDEDGKCDAKSMPDISKVEMLKMYELMVLTRAFDEKAIALQRQGRIGTYASVRGQEACQIGGGIQMNEGDLAFPAFREHALYLTRGAKPEKLFQYWGGDERGLYMPDVNVFPVAITVGGHLPHAVGAAMGMSIQKKPNVTLVYFGDGATSEGDFHEALNFAGVFKAPVVFICQNNQFAISTPVNEQTASKTLAQKAIAYGFEGIQIDGNDIFAVYKTVQEAIKKARSGKGPTFIECFTFRMGDHTTSDDAKKYRKESEVKKWEKKDPVERFKKYLITKKILSEKVDKEMQEKAKKTIAEAVESFEKIAPQDKEELFKYTYSELTPELKDEIEQFKREVS